MIEIVVSVPHSGTRTLVEHLKLPLHRPLPGWLHWGKSEGRLNRHDDIHAHVPIREPMDVAESWARRKKSLESLIWRYNAMFEWLETRPYSLHQVDKLPRLAGTEDRDRSDIPNHSLVPVYQKEVMEQVVEPHKEFFGQFYEHYRCSK